LLLTTCSTGCPRIGYLQYINATESPIVLRLTAQDDGFVFLDERIEPFAGIVLQQMGRHGRFPGGEAWTLEVFDATSRILNFSESYRRGRTIDVATRRWSDGWPAGRRSITRSPRQLTSSDSDWLIILLEDRAVWPHEALDSRRHYYNDPPGDSENEH
jgi:hypothetical protein